MSSGTRIIHSAGLSVPVAGVSIGRGEQPDGEAEGPKYGRAEVDGKGKKKT